MADQIFQVTFRHLLFHAHTPPYDTHRDMPDIPVEPISPKHISGYCQPHHLPGVQDHGRLLPLPYTKHGRNYSIQRHDE